MAENITDKLAAFGIDYADAMDRFGGNAALYERLAAKYLDDTRFVGLVAAMAAHDYDEAYRQAHSLKGLAGNLSFTRLYQAASFVCEALRNGEPARAEGHLPEVREAHEQAMAAMEQLRDER